MCPLAEVLLYGRCREMIDGATHDLGNLQVELICEHKDMESHRILTQETIFWRHLRSESGPAGVGSRTE